MQDFGRQTRQRFLRCPSVLKKRPSSPAPEQVELSQELQRAEGTY